MKKLLPILKNVVIKSNWSFSTVVLLLFLLGITKTTHAQVYYLLNSSKGNITDPANAIKKIDYGGGNDGSVTIGLPNPGLFELDIKNNRAFVYNAFLGSRVINVINMTTGAISSTISLPAAIQASGPSVTAIKYDPINDWVYYVSNSNTGTANDLNAIYRSKPDGTQNTILAKQFALLPQWLALDIPNNRVFINDGLFSGRKMLTFDLTSNTVTGSVALGNIVNAISYDPISDYIYYITSDNDQVNAGTTNDALRKIHPDGTGGEVVVKSSLINSPQYMALDAGNNRAYVYNGYYGSSGTIRLANTGIYSVDLTTGTTALVLDHSALQNTPNYLRVYGLYAIARPVVITATISTFTSTSATLGGNIISSDATATERGVVYSSSNTTPIIGGSGVTKATNGSGTGSFSASISSLSSATTYYVRAYATSTAGTGYGPVATFTTPGVPTVTAAAASSITTTSAVLGGEVTADNGATITGRGIVYSSTNITPQISGTGVTQDTNGSGTGTFSETIGSLTGGTKYYFNTYAINAVGTAYGSVLNFTTPPNAPVATAPANGSLIATTTPTYTGTALANSTVSIIVDGSSIGTTTATAGGAYSKAQPTALTQGSHTVSANATINGSAASASSNTNTFTVDTTSPTVAITSTAGSTGGSTSTSPIPITVTFSEAVTGFVAGDVTLVNGSIGTVSGSGTTYTFDVTPTTSGTATTVNIGAVVAQDAAGNGNSAATQFSMTYTSPTATVSSVTRTAISPTAMAQVTYRVVFSRSITGLSTTNFSLTTTGSISSAGLSGVTGSGTTYTVTVNTGTGNGTIRLDVDNATGISPSVTNTAYTSGETYTITKSFAAAPQLTIVGTGGTGSDVTAFIDQVQVLSGGSVFASGLQNSSFETHDALSNTDFGYNPTGATWTFNAQSGIANQGSAFTPTTPIPNGIATVFIQSNGGGNGQIQQNIKVSTGNSYQVRFQASQRICCTTLDQSMNVFMNGVFIGNIQPPPSSYTTFTSATFSVTAPVLTATISTTASNPTSTSPIPFQVVFSQAVTGFIDTDIVPANGTISGFTGSGTTYTFNVTPTAGGAVKINIAAGVAVDGNNTGNTAATEYSITYAVTVTPTTIAPSNGGLTANATPTYTGTAVANSTVTVYVDGSSIGTLTATAGGNWLLVQPTTLTEGSHTVYATAQESGKAVSAASNTNTFTVDSTRPTVAITSTAGASGSTTTTSPIPITVTFSEAVTGFVAGDLTLGNGTIGTISGSGTTYTFNLTPTTANTASTVNVPVAVAQDAAGNSNTAASQFSITYSQTAAPVTTTPANGSLIATATPGYSGTAVASSTVTVYVDGTSIGTTSATVGGTFSLAQPTNLAQGSHTVYATAQSSGQGVSAGSSTNTFTVDTTKPTVTITSTAGVSGSTTATSPVPITVTFSEAVTGFVAGDLTLANGTIGTISGSGTTYTFNFTPTANVVATINVPAFVAQDAAGNGNTAASQFSITYSQTAAPVTTAPADGGLIATTTPNYTGTAVASSTVTVYVDGTSIGTTTATAGGTFSLAQPTALSEGSHTVYETAKESGKGVSANSNTNTFTVDATKPTVVITSAAGASGATTSTSPIPFTVTFSEAVTGFVVGDITPDNGTINGFSGSGTTYTFNLIPAAFGVVKIDVAANVAQDAAANGNTAAAQFTINYQQVLPVSLVSYTAKAESNASRLEWTTASEQQNDHFEVSRSTDGNNFTVIGSVKGNGTSTVRHNYSWYDRNPQSGTNYYKLTQVDENGTAKELGIRSVDFKLKDGIAISVYPNPASSQATVNFSLGTTKIEVVDLIGNVRLSAAISPTATSYELNLQQLSPATYLIRAYNPKGILVTRLIKF